MDKLTIVIIAYNRPKSLKRLLKSIQNAVYLEEKITLVISIDKYKIENDRSLNDEVLKIAENFEWKKGDKIINYQKINLGLKEHVLQCGDLVNIYENIIVLEDDLYVSPWFYEYSLKALEFYKMEKKVSGISLYKHIYNESAEYPFLALEDSGDVFFLQIASSWGQIWNKRMWNDFREWFEIHPKIDLKMFELPEDVKKWSDNSWKKHYINYLVSKDLYFVYPRISLSTNFMDSGVHHVGGNRTLQNSFLIERKEFKFLKFVESISKYDAHCEIKTDILKKYNLELDSYDGFIVDLYGVKNLKLSKLSKYILTTRKVKDAIKIYGLEFKPHESNIIFKNLGSDIYFGEINNVLESNLELSKYEYFYTNISKKTIKLIVKKLISRIKGDC